MKNPETQPPLIGGEGSRQEELITLPDEQTITARGEKQIRTLRLLITAFNQGKPYVPNEEFLGFNIAKGAPLSLRQKISLYEAIGGIKHKALIESGWTIKSITVNGKGVETRPKGYTLIKDQAQKVDAPTSYLQSILDNKAVLEKVKQRINTLDPQEKVIFLKQTFAILSDPNPRFQDQRDAALDLLRIMDLTSINPEKLKKSYLKAVSNLQGDLNQDSDPYGEIHMLLEAGKIIAPFIEKSKLIVRAWNRVAKAFTGKDRQKILNDIKEIRQLIPTTFSEFDTNVAMDIKEGLQNQEIAAKLGVTTQEIKKSIFRLRYKGMRLNRQSGRKRTIQREQLFKDVKDLRNKGKGNLEIANELKIPYRTVIDIARDLIAKGEITRIKNSGPKKKV